MQEEGKTDDGFGPFGICHRLFNFIINAFLIRRAKSPHDDKSQAYEDDLISHDSHDTGPEIQVEFKHTNDSVVNRKNNGFNQILVHENGNSMLTRRKMDSQDQRNGNGGREKVQKKTNLTIIEGENLPGRRHHLLSVASNINEKADAFIRSKKEALEKTLTMNDV